MDSKITSLRRTIVDSQMFVVDIKKDPYVSFSFLDAVRGEVATLMQSQLFSSDFD